MAFTLSLFRSRFISKLRMADTDKSAAVPSSAPVRVDSVDAAPIQSGSRLFCYRNDGEESDMRRFDVQPKDYNDKLDQMAEAVEPGKQQLPAAQCAVGRACAATFEGDWYRAKIERLDGDQAHIRYIDYGNSNTVGLGELYVLEGKPVLQTHELSVPCSLLGLAGTHFTNKPEANREFFKLVNGEDEFQIEFVSRDASGVWQVRVYCPEEGTGELLDHFRRSGLIDDESQSASDAEPAAEEKSEPNDKPDAVATSDSKSKMQKEYDEITEKLHAEQFGQETDYLISINLGSAYTGHHVDVCDESGPQLFYVQLQGIHEEYLDTINGLLDIVSADRKTLPDAERVVGAFVAAEFEELMYRGKITSLDDDARQARVFFVDFGNSETKAYDELYVLGAEGEKVVHCAVACRLKGVRPADDADAFSKDVKRAFNELLDAEKVLTITFCGVAPVADPIGGSVYECEVLVDEGDVAAQLAQSQDGLLQTTGDDEQAIEDQLVGHLITVLKGAGTADIFEC